MSMGSVYLVGAGCGAADLITVRGQRLLRRCDAVVYDDLIDPALLELVPAHAQRIYMGKRSGHHSAPQAEISETLIALAREGKLVVRLKGGDPFVFGRGGEEMQALLGAGIPCETVSGVTSAIAIPAEAGIPVTHRGLSRSVHIITAHTADMPDGLPADLDRLAQLHGTLVFLMGLRQLPRIAQRLMAAGMAAQTPAAVLSSGNSPCPAAVRGTLEDIAQKARDVKPPAVIVVGEVAAMTLQSPRKAPCAALTGTDAVLHKLEAALEEKGVRTFRAQRSVVRELPAPLDLAALAEGERYLVFTSANGVDVFFKRLRREEFDVRRLHGCRFAVIGRGTGRKLREYGVIPGLCPAVYTGEALAAALLDAVPKGTPIHLLRSRLGNPQLREILERDYPVEDIPLYDLCDDGRTAAAASERLREADYLTFSSASGVELYFAAHGAVPEGTLPVCIGPVTAQALRRRYSGPMLTAAQATAASMAQLISERAKAEGFDMN